MLYSFAGGPSDGASPVAGLIADSSGNLYGTTGNGGSSACFAGCGVVFKLAGTGFVTTTPFLAFKAKLEIGENSFELNSSFTLKSGASIDPATEPVTLKVGTFSTTIPAGSFTKDRDGDKFTFEGNIDGVRLEALIELDGTLRYAFNAEGGGRESGRDKKPGSGDPHHRRRQRHDFGQRRVRRLSACRQRSLRAAGLQVRSRRGPPARRFAPRAR